MDEILFKINRLRKAMRGAVIGLFLLGLLSACQFFHLKQELRDLDEFVRLRGSVRAAKQGVIYVLVFTDNNRLIKYQVLSGADLFDFYLKEGRYELVAFADLNRDGRYQTNEPAAHRTMS